MKVISVTKNKRDQQSINFDGVEKHPEFDLSWLKYKFKNLLHQFYDILFFAWSYKPNCVQKQKHFHLVRTWIFVCPGHNAFTLWAGKKKKK